MSPRCSGKIPPRSKRAAGARAVARQPEFNELSHLLSDIRTRLSGLSQTYGRPAHFRSPQPYVCPRSTPSAARVEAEALYRLVKTGRDSIENVRELIAVPPKFEAGVEELSSSDPCAQKTLLASLKFRKQVWKEFESLVVGDQLAAKAAGAGAGEPLSRA